MSELVNWRQRAGEALGRTDIMVLATVDADSGAWASPVQFQPGDDFKLTFLSHPVRGTAATSSATRGSLSRSTAGPGQRAATSACRSPAGRSPKATARANGGAS